MAFDFSGHLGAMSIIIGVFIVAHKKTLLLVGLTIDRWDCDLLEMYVVEFL